MKGHLIKEVHSKGIRLSKKRGQCLLTDNNIMDKILAAADLRPDDLVIDVGAGPGHLIDRFTGVCGQYFGVEIDKACFKLAQEKAGRIANAEVMHADILADKHHLNPDVLDRIEALAGAVKPGRVMLVANLPYHIAAPVILHFLAQDRIPLDRMVVMVQREMAVRLTARPNTPGFGAISVLLQTYARASTAFAVSRNCFFPKPKVESAVAVIEPMSESERPVARDQLSGFTAFVRAIFNFPKKKVINSILNAHFVEYSKTELIETFENNGISATKSIMACGPEDLAAMYAVLIKG
ncbi:16S rRNA (adenine(1518)-N(6)/adenine(1519)-N(6))-dimethyltransferase RsmA [Planctomycetota bacterium]